MGAAIGGVLVSGGARVGWVGTGRSAATHRRADEAGLVDLGTVERIKDECAVVLSVCPPHAAAELAREIVGFQGVYVDANAISPALTHQVGEIVTAAGARYVDGGIVGPPPHRPGTTRLFLAGDPAGEVAALFAGTTVEAKVVGAEPGAASALKMVYAAWTKGTTAMLVALRAAARRLGVEAELLEEWAMSQPELPRLSEQAARTGLERGWRWAFELEEVGRTFADAGLPEGFGMAAAAVYHRLTGTAEDGVEFDLDRALALLAREA